MIQHHTLCSSLHVQLGLVDTYHTMGAETQRSDGAAVDHAHCTPTGATDVVLEISVPVW